jgi:hypothetical protein
MAFSQDDALLFNLHGVFKAAAPATSPGLIRKKWL